MKKKLFAALFFAGIMGFSQNLILDGGFDKARPDLYPECRSDGGKISLFTENLNWNRCAKLEIDRIRKNSAGNECVGACIWIGGDNRSNAKPGGFICKPDTVYRFSFDAKGTAADAGVGAFEWGKGKKLWDMKSLKTTVGSIAVQKEWTNYKGTFKTGPDAGNAAIYIQLWWNTQYGPQKFKVGDYILIDNVKVEEDKAKTLAPPTAAAPKTVKITDSSNSVVEDFRVFGKDEKPSSATKAILSSDASGIRIRVECAEPVRVVKASSPNLWSGDTLELFFSLKNGNRRFSQFAVGPGGETDTGDGVRAVKLPWTVKTAVTAEGWSAEAEIPYSSLGTPAVKPGDEISFNLARQRTAAKELISWAPVRTGFGEVESFGRLLLGKCPGGMTRPQYEKASAEKAAAELKAKFEKNAKSTFLAAPVRITEDFSIPFQPDAVFNPPEKIELKTAVNEIRPLALAILNNTDKTAKYRVTVEIPRTGKNVRPWMNGTPFPGATVRRAVRVRDTKDANGAMFDPLPKIGETSSIVVPPKEAGLVWIDFNTAGMKPGVVSGRIRIVPLTGKGGFDESSYWTPNYAGEMRDIPLTLEVRNIVLDKDPAIPLGLFCGGGDSGVLNLMREMGARWFNISPWSFKFPLKNGKFVPELPLVDAKLKQFDFKNGDRISITYSAYDTFLKLYGKDHAALWPEWIRTVAEYLSKRGVDLKKTRIEIFDEPDPKQFDILHAAFSSAKKAAPDMLLMCTLGAHIMSAADMEKLSPFVDCWTLWSRGYFSRPEHLAFIRKVQSQGKSVTHYTCDTNLRSPTDRNYRRNAWFGEYYRLDGNDLFQGFEQRPGLEWAGIPYGNVLYSDNGPAIPSIRSMAVRQGMTDVKYLAKLREVGKNSPEAQKFLETAAKRVCVDFAHDPEMPDKVREEAAELILKLQKEAR